MGFGTSSLHHLRRSSDRQRLLDAAYAAGIRYFDTAPLYGHGLAERELGLFRRRLSPGDPITVATKTGISPNAIVSRIPWLLLPYVAIRSVATRTGLLPSNLLEFRRNYSASQLRSGVELSLNNLQAESLDVVFLHEPHINHLVSLEDFSVEAEKLRFAGKVKRFGISGGLTESMMLRLQKPSLAQILQIEIHPSNDHQSPHASWLQQNANSTFGHLRLSSKNSVSGIGWLHAAAQKAVTVNTNGTVLFSTTKINRISTFVRAIQEADTLNEF